MSNVQFISKMKVVVKSLDVTQKVCEIEVEAWSTVRDVKNRLSQQHALGAPELLKLFFQGKVLEDNETLNGTVNYSEDKFMVVASIEGDVVFISGATGVYATEINGTFDCTSEMCDDVYPLYVKRGNASMYIQHHDGNWKVRSVSNIGKSACYAFVTGGCALEACTSRVWTEYDGTRSEVANGVKMVTGAEAKLQVGGARSAYTLPPLCILGPSYL